MKKTNLIILFISLFFSNIHSQENNVENEMVLKITFSKGFNMDTVSLSLNDNMIMDRNILKTNLSDGLANQELFFFIENSKIRVVDLKGNKYIIPYRDSIFNFKICLNNSEKKCAINLKKGKFIYVQYKRNKIHYIQSYKRTRFF